MRKVILLLAMMSSSAMGEMHIDDLKIDIAALQGQKVMVSGIGKYIMNSFMLNKNVMDTSPVPVDLSKVHRDQRMEALQICSDVMVGCGVTVSGTVVKISGQYGISATKIEFETDRQVNLIKEKINNIFAILETVNDSGFPVRCDGAEEGAASGDGTYMLTLCELPISMKIVAANKTPLAQKFSGEIKNKKLDAIFIGDLNVVKEAKNYSSFQNQKGVVIYFNLEESPDIFNEIAEQIVEKNEIEVSFKKQKKSATFLVQRIEKK